MLWHGSPSSHGAVEISIVLFLGSASGLEEKEKVGYGWIELFPSLGPDFLPLTFTHNMHLTEFISTMTLRVATQHSKR